MGVVYKLQPEVKAFILEQKRNNPSLSCRKLSDLISDKFQIIVSKSSINFIVKEAGLSMPVGRRQKRKKGGLNPEIGLDLKKKLEQPMRALFLEEPSDSSDRVEVVQPEIPRIPEEPKEAPVDKQEIVPKEKIVLKPVEALPEEPVSTPMEESVPEALTEAPVEESAPEAPCSEVPVEESASEPASVAPMEEPIEPLPEEPVLEAPLDAPVEELAPEAPSSEAPVEEPVPETPPEIPVEEPAIMPVDKPVEKSPELPIPELPPAEKQEEIRIEEPELKLEIEEPSEAPCSGAILLKAADYLAGGVNYIVEAIRNRLNSRAPELLAKTEFLLYSKLKSEYGLPGLVNYMCTPEEISSYLNILQSVTGLSSDIFQIISTVFQEVRYVKVTMSDNTVFYLDGQLHTVWSTPNIPFDFCSTIYNIKTCIDRYFKKDAPLVLFMAPGYDIPTQEFFDFVSTQQDGQETISRLTLCGHKFDEIDGFGLERGKRQLLVFGLWPWQFIEYRKVNKIGEFKPHYIEALKKDFYLADIEIDLSQTTAGKLVTLSGCALKTSISEKTRLIILSNFPYGLVSLENLANIYLNRWPNLEEAFKDFSRKIELFTYTADSQRLFSTESIDLLVKQESMQEISPMFDYYLKALDLYVRWNFMPSGYGEKDFSTMNESFYSLKAQAIRQKGLVSVVFQPPSAYPCVKELDYVCRRVNEKEIIFANGKRLWLSL